MMQIEMMSDEQLEQALASPHGANIQNPTDAFYAVYELAQRGRSEESLSLAEDLKHRFPIVGEAVAAALYSEGLFHNEPSQDGIWEWLRWMDIAAATEPEAAMMLGSFYESVQDYDEARRAYEKGVAIGAAESAFAIGYLYEQGHGVELNLVTACEWFMRAGMMDWAGWIDTKADEVPVGEDGLWRDAQLLNDYLRELPPGQKQRLLSVIYPDQPYPDITRKPGTPLIARVMLYGQSPERIMVGEKSLLERADDFMQSTALSREELDGLLATLESNLGQMLHDYPEPADFWGEFQERLTPIMTGTGPHDREHVSDRIVQMLLTHALDPSAGATHTRH